MGADYWVVFDNSLDCQFRALDCRNIEMDTQMSEPNSLTAIGFKSYLFFTDDGRAMEMLFTSNEDAEVQASYFKSKGVWVEMRSTEQVIEAINHYCD